jgi:predicted nucleic acid-binding protein
LLTTNAVIVIPSDIFTETINVLGKKAGRATALRAITELTSGSAFAITETNVEMRASAADKFAQQPRSVSFADCLVMATADFYGLTEIFGFDRAFADNGYTTISHWEEPEAA